MLAKTSLGRPFFHERCARLIECLPSLQHDPNRPEDVLEVDADAEGVGGDGPADCLRYLIATKRRTVTSRKLLGLCPPNSAFSTLHSAFKWGWCWRR
jgi:hypothetical protein